MSDDHKTINLDLKYHDIKAILLAFGMALQYMSEEMNNEGHVFGMISSLNKFSNAVGITEENKDDNPFKEYMSAATVSALEAAVRVNPNNKAAVEKVLQDLEAGVSND